MQWNSLDKNILDLKKGGGPGMRSTEHIIQEVDANVLFQFVLRISTCFLFCSPVQICVVQEGGTLKDVS